MLNNRTALLDTKAGKQMSQTATDGVEKMNNV